MDKEFFSKVPCCFKTALESGEVSFNTDPEVMFTQFDAYRGIFRSPGSSYDDINRKDFLSQAEIGRKYNPRHGSKDSFYSCSTFLTMNVLRLWFFRMKRKIEKLHWDL